MVAPGGTLDDQTAVVRVLNDYYSAFSTLEVQKVLPYFCEPSVLIGPQGVFVAASRTNLTTMLTPVIEGLRARGFGRSELSVRNVELLSATVILVMGVALRYKVDGQELERAGVTYVLHKSGTQWRIAVLIVHDPTKSPDQ
jgi:hypothetical protein